MPPPLLQLSDIALTLRRHAAARWRRAVGVGGRARVPRRAQRLGQVDAAEDRRGADRARSRQALRAAGRDHPLPAAGAGPLPATRRRWPMSRPASAPATTRTRRATCCSSSASPARRTPRTCRAARARRAALAHVLAPAARHPAARRADQPSRPAHHRMARRHARQPARRAGAHQPRPALPREPVAHHCLARPRQSAARRARLRRLRGLARPAARRGGGGAAQARPQDRRARSTGCATA